MFIGQNIDQALIKKTLDAVTLNDKEWAQWEKVGHRSGKIYRLADRSPGHEVEEVGGEKGREAVRPVRR